MRTPAEINERIKQADDFFGTEAGDLIEALPWAEARKHYKDDFVAKVDRGEEPAPVPKTDDEVRAEIVSYLDFAWDKAMDERGNSASRSIYHFRAWCWLIGDDEACAFLDEDDNFAPYGKPMLAFLSKRYGHTPPDGYATEAWAK